MPAVDAGSVSPTCAVPEIVGTPVAAAFAGAPATAAVRVKSATRLPTASRRKSDAQ